MNTRRIIAVAVIFLVAAAGWWILGAATAVRSTTQAGRLGPQVEGLWGAPLAQSAPVFEVQMPGSGAYQRLLPQTSHIDVAVMPDHRKKGLIWYPTYTCAFMAAYHVTGDGPVARKVRLHFDFPSAAATYDNFAMTVDGSPAEVRVDTAAGIDHIIEVAPGQVRTVVIRYETRGMASWRYRFDERLGRVRGLEMTVRTTFRDVDYPEGCLSPMDAEETEDGMLLRWQASDLISRSDIGVVIPEKLNPGPLTSRITFFAPVCLLFFFVLVAAINVIYRLPIHPMHYLFVAGGFFAFHLLLCYLAGLVHIHLAFILSAAVSVGLVTGYLRAALRGRFPWKLALAGQAFFLVLFSYSFFIKGITGLTIAVGSVATLAVLMKVTAHVNWEAVFGMLRPSQPKPPAPATASPEGVAS